MGLGPTFHRGDITVIDRMGEKRRSCGTRASSLTIHMTGFHHSPSHCLTLKHDSKNTNCCAVELESSHGNKFLIY